MDLHRTAGRVGADAEADQLLLKARREITEHCLYGVDINPLAVEMAKLSLWLITMDRERPFGFLDDRLAAGDCLLGLVSLEQLETLHVDAKEGRRLHHGTLDFADGWRDKLAAGRRPPPPDHRHRRRHDPRHRAQGPAARPGRETVRRRSPRSPTRSRPTGLANAKLKGKKLDEAFLQLYVKVSNEEGPGPATSRRTSRTRARRARSNANPSTGRWRSPRSSPTRRRQASTPSSATPRSWAARRSPAHTATTILPGFNAGTAMTSRATPTLPRGSCSEPSGCFQARAARLRHRQHARRRCDTPGRPGAGRHMVTDPRRTLAPSVANEEREPADRGVLGQSRTAIQGCHLLAGRRRSPCDRPRPRTLRPHSRPPVPAPRERRHRVHRFQHTWPGIHAHR